MATILRRSSRLATPLVQGIQPEATNIPNSGPVQAAVIQTDTPLLVGTVPEQRTFPVRRDSTESTRTEPRTVLSNADLQKLAAILQNGSAVTGPSSLPHSSNKSKRATASEVCSNLFRLIGLLFLKFLSFLFLGDNCVNLAASIFSLILAFTVAYRGCEAVASAGAIVLSTVTFIRGAIGTPWLDLITPTNLYAVVLSYIAPFYRAGVTTQLTATEIIVSTLTGIIVFLPLQWINGKHIPMKLLSLLSGVLLTFWAGLYFAISTDPQSNTTCPPNSALATLAVGVTLFSIVLCVLISGFFATSALRAWIPQTSGSNQTSLLDQTHLTILKLLEFVELVEVVHPLVDHPTSLHSAGLHSTQSQSEYKSNDDKVTTKSPVRFSETVSTSPHHDAARHDTPGLSNYFPTSSDNDSPLQVEHANVFLAKNEREADPHATSTVPSFLLKRGFHLSETKAKKCPKFALVLATMRESNFRALAQDLYHFCRNLYFFQETSSKSS